MVTQNFSKARKLKRHFDLKDYLTACRIKAWKNRKWINLENDECPNCQEKRRGGLHKDSLVYHCGNCGISLDLISWLKEREGVDFKGAIEIMEKYQA